LTCSNEGPFPWPSPGGRSHSKACPPPTVGGPAPHSGTGNLLRRVANGLGGPAIHGHCSEESGRLDVCVGGRAGVRCAPSPHRPLGRFRSTNRTKWGYSPAFRGRVTGHLDAERPRVLRKGDCSSSAQSDVHLGPNPPRVKVACRGLQLLAGPDVSATARGSPGGQVICLAHQVRVDPRAAPAPPRSRPHDE